MRKIKKEFDPTITVKQLRKILKGMPSNGHIYYERIEDVYFKKYHWKPAMIRKNDFNDDCEYIQAWWITTDGKNLYVTAHF